MDRNKNKSRFCTACPRKLGRAPDSPCPLALERIHAIQTMDEEGKKKKDVDNLPGCPWYVTDAKANNCFFSMMMNEPEPFSDKEIGDTLLLSQAQINRSYDNAMAKLRENKNSEEIRDLKETVYEKVASREDSTIYLPDKFASILEQPLVPEEEAVDPDLDNIIDIKKPKSKVQLYGLYSKKKLEELKKNGRLKKNKKE